MYTFVAKKTEEILEDVDKVKVVTDNLIHFPPSLLPKLAYDTSTTMFPLQSWSMPLAMYNMLTMQLSSPSCSVAPNTSTEMEAVATIGALQS